MAPRRQRHRLERVPVARIGHRKDHAIRIGRERQELAILQEPRGQEIRKRWLRGQVAWKGHRDAVQLGQRLDIVGARHEPERLQQFSGRFGRAFLQLAYPSAVFRPKVCLDPRGSRQ